MSGHQSITARLQQILFAPTRRHRRSRIFSHGNVPPYGLPEWREKMRCVSWLAAAGLVMVTAGCVEQSGYPTTYGYSPGYGSSNYGYSGYSNNYVSQPDLLPAGPDLLRTAAAPAAGNHPDALRAGAGVAAPTVLSPVEGQRPGWHPRPLRPRQERRRCPRQVPALALVISAKRRVLPVAPSADHFALSPWNNGRKAWNSRARNVESARIRAVWRSSSCVRNHRLLDSSSIGAPTRTRRGSPSAR